MNSFAVKLGYKKTRIHIGGGAVLNACYVLENPPAIYFKPSKPELGGGCFWDFAATACLFHEAGAHVSDFTGKPLELNRAEGFFMNHCGVCYASNSELAEALMALSQ